MKNRLSKKPGILFFLLPILFCSLGYVYAQVVRPKVDDSGDWKNVDAGQLTGDWSDSRKVVWRRIEKGEVAGITGSTTVVVDTDKMRSANIWFDRDGAHFFDLRSGQIKTPVDFRGSGFRSGPGVDYEIASDPSFSYFYVCWWKTKFDEQENFVSSDVSKVFLDRNGKTLWKKRDIFKANDLGKMIGAVAVSPDGKLLVDFADGEDLSGNLEIWDKRGRFLEKVVSKITPWEFFWSRDGKNIVIKCRHNKKAQYSYFDIHGNYLKTEIK